MEPPAQQVGAALSDDAPSLQASFGPSHGRDGAPERSGRSGPAAAAAIPRARTPRPMSGPLPTQTGRAAYDYEAKRLRLQCRLERRNEGVDLPVAQRLEETVVVEGGDEVKVVPPLLALLSC